MAGLWEGRFPISTCGGVAIGVGCSLLLVVGCAGSSSDAPYDSGDASGVTPLPHQEWAEDGHEGTDTASLPDVGRGADPGALYVCSDPSSAVYDPVEEEALESAERGAIFACGDDGRWPAAALASRLGLTGLESQSGVHRLRLAYRTERSPGVAGVTSGALLVPDPPPAEPADLVIFAHGTTGLADHCAPSRYAGYFDTMALAFVSQGYVVVVPDYAGLGTPGVQGYGDGVDTTHSLLDAPAAVRRVLGPERVSERSVMVGYSQGAGAALNAHGMAASYGLEGSLAAVVALAGTVHTHPSVDPGPFKWAGYVQANYAYGSSAAFGSLMLYAYGANQVDPPDPGVLFHQEHSAQIQEWVETLCIGDLVTEFAALDDALMFDDVFSPAFYSGVLECLEGTAPCDALYGGYVQRLQDSYIPADPGGPPILLHAGALDALVPPNKVACTRDALAGWGKTPTTCVNPGASHDSIVAMEAAHSVAWVTAVLDGDELPPCPSPWATLPPCDE